MKRLGGFGTSGGAGRLGTLVRSPYVILVLPPLFWAGNAVIARAMVGDLMSPMALSFWRWVLAGLLLLPIGGPRVLAAWPVIRRHWRLLTLEAVLAVTAYNSLLYIALQTTTAINATLVGASLPVVTVALAWPFLGERPGRRQVLGIVLSLVGVMTVVTRGQPDRLATLALGQGDGLILAATVGWAVYSILLRRHPVALDPIAFLTVLVAIGTACLALPYAWELGTGLAHGPDGLPALAAIAYTAVFAGILAYALWNRGVAAVGAGTAALYVYLIPAFTAVLAIGFLGETLHWFHAVGVAAIFAGIRLATVSPARGPRRS